MDNDNPTMALSCPKCGGTRLLVKEDDINAEGHFIGNPKVGCMTCGALLDAYDLVPQESSYGQTLHLVGAL